MQKENRVARSEPEPHDEPAAVGRLVGEPRSKKGHKRSKASHNKDGLMEKELKELRLIENAPCRQYKKRRLKDLKEEEVDEIIAATKKRGWLQKDVAQKFRVTPKLVSTLSKEANLHPEKLAARR